MEGYTGSMSGSNIVSEINLDQTGVQISGAALHFSGSEFYLGSEDNYISGADIGSC